MRRPLPTLLATLLPALALLVACGGGQPAGPAPTPARSAEGRVAQPGDAAVWPIKTREHVDLWLHGFAMVSEDTTRVPYFRRGYRDAMTVLKNQGNVTTQLDTNRARLQARFATNRELTGAQFVALYFGSWAELRQGIDYFLKADGEPRRANNQQLAGVIGFLANFFPTAADREWLRLFAASLNDESEKFYHQYWLREQRERAPVLAALDTLWQRQYRPKLQRFLNNTQQQSGDFLLSLPLDGEGRTLGGGNAPGSSARQNLVTVAFPAQPTEADEAVFVFVHEVAGTLAASAVSDNTTPNEKRSGLAERLQSAAAVRTGAVLVERALPELADGYARYYLRAAGAPSPAGGDPRAALAAAFPLPEGLRDAIVRQLDVVLGGI